MSRLTDALLNGTAYNTDQPHPMLNLVNGGQFGYSTDLTEWVSNQNYVRKNIFCLLLEAPQFFQYMPNPDKWVATLRALVELHPRSIEGLNAGLKVETQTTPVGGAGEEQDEVTNVTREKSTPSFVYDEKYGMPISSFLGDWITYGLMDPNTKIANVGTISGANVPDMLADRYAMTCIFIEPDPTHKKVLKAWLTTNMFPKSNGDIVGKRDLTAAGELNSLNIEFSGISQYNLGTVMLAQKLLDSINITNANPYLRPAFVQDISADVAKQTKGYNSEATKLGTTAVNR